MAKKIDRDLVAFARWKAEKYGLSRRVTMQDSMRLQKLRNKGHPVTIMKQGKHVFSVVGAKKDD